MEPKLDQVQFMRPILEEIGGVVVDSRDLEAEHENARKTLGERNTGPRKRKTKAEKEAEAAKKQAA